MSTTSVRKQKCNYEEEFVKREKLGTSAFCEIYRNAKHY